MQYDAAAVSTAIARIDRDPIGLTETDFVLLKEFMGDAVETRARDAQHAAILARVPPAPVLTKAVAAPKAAIDAAALAGITTFEEFCQKFPNQPATLQLVGQLTAFVVAMNENNKTRNVKITALETRVLELEATIAARQTVRS